MGSKYLTDLATVCRNAGLPVREYGGWQTRARGSGGYDSGRPTHVMAHHTASPTSWSGQKDADYCAVGDEDAPLSNLYLDRDGVVWVLAAGATNTNGSGHDYWGGGVPDNSMNSYAIGIEANGGYGSAWPQVQQEAYVTLCATLCDHYNIPTKHVRGHFEWAPDRKVDPSGPSNWSSGSASWNMDQFRADVEAGGDMPLSKEDIDKIAEAVWSKMIDTTGKDAGIDPQPARYWLQRTYLIVRQNLSGFNGKPATDPTLLKQIKTDTGKIK
jgi:hypothetical protein